MIATLIDIIPMTAFVFPGTLEPFVATGIGINLFSSAILGLVIALGSSFKGIIAFPVAEEMATLAVILNTVARQIPSSASPEEVVLTIIGAIILSSLLVGVFLLIVDQLKLSQRPLFIDEADYLFQNSRMIDAVRDTHDLTELPVWLIGSQKLEK